MHHKEAGAQKDAVYQIFEATSGRGKAGHKITSICSMNEKIAFSKKLYLIWIVIILRIAQQSLQVLKDYHLKRNSHHYYDLQKPRDTRHNGAYFKIEGPFEKRPMIS